MGSGAAISLIAVLAGYMTEGIPGAVVVILLLAILETAHRVHRSRTCALGLND
jgi:hypothetical protein